MACCNPVDGQLQGWAAANSAYNGATSSAAAASGLQDAAAKDFRALEYSRRSGVRSSGKRRTGGDQFHRLELRRQKYVEAQRAERASKIKLVRSGSGGVSACQQTM